VVDVWVSLASAGADDRDLVQDDGLFGRQPVTAGCAFAQRFPLMLTEEHLASAETSQYVGRFRVLIDSYPGTGEALGESC